ncbi:MAG: 54S ribosomal protein L39, mitochondrial [Phylliscum demangeonii]|nr:MAG: 54S ribosomal protein L39, mitochondrial [Phylliscum demangeonii]
MPPARIAIARLHSGTLSLCGSPLAHFPRPLFLSARRNHTATVISDPAPVPLVDELIDIKPPTLSAVRRPLLGQELFATSILSPGSPFLTPPGAHIFNVLVAFLRAQHSLFGFQEVVTPTIYKRSLWVQSGHWQYYQDDMYEVRGRGAMGHTEGKEAGDDEDYGLKPMNCPGHCLLYQFERKSYRQLPIRYAEFSPLHRNEPSGSLTGLTRLRRFHQDDGHIFCMSSQILQEVRSTLDFIAMVYRTFKLPPFKLVLSTRPRERYAGSEAVWAEAEDALKQALSSSGQEWTVNEGEGAFYGPKIDIILKDSDGKELQTATIQLDFQLPQRFDLQYVGRSCVERPVLIHRAIFGSVERFMALLIEHYQGKWPFWLSPRQAVIMTVGQHEQLPAYSALVASSVRGLPGPGPDPEGRLLPRPLHTPTFAVDVDDSSCSLSRKFRTAKLKNYNFLIAVGPAEQAQGTLRMNITGYPDRELAREILTSLLGSETIGDSRAVIMKPEQANAFFRRLTERYG